MNFSQFDTRGYRTLSIARGYATWAPTYDATMRITPIDLPLLDRLKGSEFRAVASAVDLGCGTGRIGAWLRARGVGAVDGVDRSAPMLRFARKIRRYRRLARASVLRSGLPAGGYGLAISSLVACHLPDLRPFYREMARLVRPGGRAAVVDFHPFFLLNGVPTHFSSGSGSPLAIRNEVHLLSDHVRTATATGWRLDRFDELAVPRAWLRSNPGWRRHLGRPVSFMMVYVKARGGAA